MKTKHILSIYLVAGFIFISGKNIFAAEKITCLDKPNGGSITINSPVGYELDEKQVENWKETVESGSTVKISEDGSIEIIAASDSIVDPDKGELIVNENGVKIWKKTISIEPTDDFSIENKNETASNDAPVLEWWTEEVTGDRVLLTDIDNHAQGTVAGLSRSVTNTFSTSLETSGELNAEIIKGKIGKTVSSSISITETYNATVQPYTRTRVYAVPVGTRYHFTYFCGSPFDLRGRGAWTDWKHTKVEYVNY